jgi:hypothetical protein
MEARMASIKGRLAASLAPVAAIIEEPPAEDKADQVDRLLRMYDACQAGQARLRDVIPHAKGDERYVALVCRHNLLQFATAIATRGSAGEIFTELGTDVLTAVQTIRALARCSLTARLT